MEVAVTSIIMNALDSSMVVYHGRIAALVTSLPPSGPRELSVLTYNVLLPNSIDGWWTYKM